MNQMNQMFGQMMMWPMSMFADMFSRSMQGMQCMPMPSAPASPLPCPPREASCGTTARGRGDDWSGSPRRDDTWHGGGGGKACGCGCDCSSCRSGSCCHHCGCDTVRLVEYSVVNIARGSRHDRDTPVHCRQILLRDCETAEEFNNQVIAEYAREHQQVDAKNLRVYFKVLDSWCKEQWDYEEEQIDALREIRNAIARGDHKQREEQGQGR